MVTDPIFYRLFETRLDTFFLLLGLPIDSANEMAARYQYEAHEFKATSFRTDGVFRPKEADRSVYFLEVQFYRLPSVFADLLAKVYIYLKQHDPAQPFIGVVLFATRALEPKGLKPYQALIDAGLIRRYYLDELPELADAPLGMSILYLLRQEDNEAAATARDLVARTKQEIDDEALQVDLIQLIETVIMHKLPGLSWQEIRAMLKIHDIRESRAYQEIREIAIRDAKQEVMKEADEQMERRLIEEKLKAVPKMKAFQMNPQDIADILDLEIDIVRHELANKSIR